ncbi:hypothetical protein Bbelb_320080 [Branchiostoma belcheri]|nr:hypothetical protein Bbelb_320080 [Branchiostoma belcheri]
MTTSHRPLGFIQVSGSTYLLNSVQSPVRYIVTYRRRAPRRVVVSDTVASSRSRSRGVPLRPFSLPDASTRWRSDGRSLVKRLLTGSRQQRRWRARSARADPLGGGTRQPPWNVLSGAHHCARRSLPRQTSEPPLVARSRTESGPPVEKSYEGKRNWGRLYPGGGAPLTPG